MKTASKLNTKILIKNILDNHVWVEKIKWNFLLFKKGRGSTRFSSVQGSVETERDLPYPL